MITAYLIFRPQFTPCKIYMNLFILHKFFILQSLLFQPLCDCAIQDECYYFLRQEARFPYKRTKASQLLQTLSACSVRDECARLLISPQLTVPMEHLYLVFSDPRQPFNEIINTNHLLCLNSEFILAINCFDHQP